MDALPNFADGLTAGALLVVLLTLGRYMLNEFSKRTRDAEETLAELNREHQEEISDLRDYIQRMHEQMVAKAETNMAAMYTNNEVIREAQKLVRELLVVLARLKEK